MLKRRDMEIAQSHQGGWPEGTLSLQPNMGTGAQRKMGYVGRMAEIDLLWRGSPCGGKLLLSPHHTTPAHSRPHHAAPMLQMFPLFLGVTDRSPRLC